MREILVKSFLDCIDYYLEEKATDYVIISIQDAPKGFGKTFIPRNNCKDVVTLYFDDIDKETTGFTLITSEHAKIIADFILKHRNIDTFIIHCKFGQSRSSGVAHAIKDYLGGKIIAENRQLPNPHVYRLIIQELKRKRREWLNVFNVQGRSCFATRRWGIF